MSQLVSPRTIARASISLLAGILSLALAGCPAAIPAATQLAQGGVAAVGYTAIEAGEHKADKHTPGSIDDQEERCDALVGSSPGVEEVRKDKDDTIETRQWRLVDASNPRWTIVRSKNGPEDAWEPKPGIITHLKFKPPLSDQLDYKKSQFLAYAPNDLENIDDSRAMTSITEAFGAPVGSFQWRGKTYGYVLVPQLPCFPAEK